MATSQTIAYPDNKQRQKGERESQTAVLRDFQGVNVRSPREAIGDDEFAWLEGLIPIGPGNLTVINGPGVPIVTIAETGAPTYTTEFVVAGIAYVFAVWAGSGDAWVGPAQTSVGWVKIATAVFTSRHTAAAQWSNLGLLIVDPIAGYYDWNVTTPATLTHLSGQIINPVLNPAQPGAGFPVRVIDTGGGGTGATIGYSMTAASVLIFGGGSGYAVGDLLTFVGGALTTATQAPAGQQNQPTVISITAVTGIGGITGYALFSNGFYQTPPAGVIATTGGSGVSGTFTANWEGAGPYIITAGTDYVTPQVQYNNAGWVDTTFITLTSSGTVLGSQIAVYVDRVWIAIDRTVQFTDADSYNSFGNSGSAFTINDSYLLNEITGLFAANNYLYIFGDTSVDVLSNVTVNAGTVSFSRINASASIGTSQPNSVFAYQRAIAFANANGFYILSGATPQKISERVDGLFPQIDFGAGVYGCQVMTANELCAAFLFSFTDIFTYPLPGVARTLLAVMYRNKWHFISQTADTTLLTLTGMVSVPVGSNDVQTLFSWAGPTLYSLMTAAPTGQWMARTKLWDGGAPIDDKQGLNAGIAADFNGQTLDGVVITIDTELSSVPTSIGAGSQIVQWINNSSQVVQWINTFSQIVEWISIFASYQFLKGPANNGGGKYIGMTVTGASDVSKIHLLALEYTNTRRW